ncbi:TRAP transporter large permease [Sporosarcina pasteurii]|uniref:Neu5Ac permease n=1 Tax=Sporosarcina pasteurii TaxID=1474 RepID=A0A380BX41_SPOPA|nr:TRAP transporter large permease [Sporosarcina pasteurii]MDS9471399.1 TRAP transporter large permease [Sporosarcina pasteurii]QBQ04975.1 TRAP transporter large permease [Sporosarcina pasteurii]SUJ08852.1 Neu5Ac permease [Sporosarcina pasteurii]
MIISLVLFLLFLLLRIPIAIVLGITSVILLFFAGNLGLIINSPQRLFSALESYSLLAIPLFMLAGEIMNAGGITIRLVNFAQKFVGHFRGGLAYVNIVANTFLAAIIGSAAAQIAMMSKIMIPAMEKEGYRREFGAATTAASGMLGPIIPPSMLFIIYGASAGISIGDMFLAGIIPGILLAISFVLLVAYIGYKEEFKKAEKIPWKERGKSLIQILPALSVPGILIWGIVTGVFTPTESAGIACVIALIISLFFYKDLKLKELPGIFVNTAITTSIVTLLIAMASLFGWSMTFERIPQMIAEWLTTVTTNPVIFLLLINVLFILLGMFIEGIALIIILTPIFIPILPVFGIDPIHFGVIICLNVVIGILTPPVGSGLFLTTSIGKVKLEDFIKAVLPFVAVSIFVLLLITFIPELVLWIPSLVN